MRILFVCEGNTCRSPMAAEIAKRDIAEHGYTGFEIVSAGICRGTRTAEDAITVARNNGCDLTHTPTQLKKELLEKSDRVFVMETWQIGAVSDIGEHGHVETLFEDVDDPYGRGPDAYRETWEQLERLIQPKLAELSKYSDAKHSHR
jgi:protein-tyrosine-phosphatase